MSPSKQDDEKEMIDAAQDGNLEVVREYLKMGTNVNAKDHFGSSALHCASSEGSDAIVSLLLEWNADVNAKDKDDLTPLYMACENGNIGVVKSLVKNGADLFAKDGFGMTALDEAHESGHKEIVSLLMTGANGTDGKNWESPLPFLLAGITDEVSALSDSAFGALAISDSKKSLGDKESNAHDPSQQQQQPQQQIIPPSFAPHAARAGNSKDDMSGARQSVEISRKRHIRSQSLTSVGTFSASAPLSTDEPASAETFSRQPPPTEDCLHPDTTKVEQGHHGAEQQLALTGQKDLEVQGQDSPRQDVAAIVPTDNDVCFKKSGHRGTERWREVIKVFSGNRLTYRQWKASFCNEIQNQLQSNYGIERYLIYRDENGNPVDVTANGRWHEASPLDILTRTRERFQEDRKARSQSLPREVKRPRGRPKKQKMNLTHANEGLTTATSVASTANNNTSFAPVLANSRMAIQLHHMQSRTPTPAISSSLNVILQDIEKAIIEGGRIDGIDMELGKLLTNCQTAIGLHQTQSLTPTTAISSSLQLLLLEMEQCLTRLDELERTTNEGTYLPCSNGRALEPMVGAINAGEDDEFRATIFSLPDDQVFGITSSNMAFSELIADATLHSDGSVCSDPSFLAAAASLFSFSGNSGDNMSATNAYADSALCQDGTSQVAGAHHPQREEEDNMSAVFVMQALEEY